MNTTRAVVLLIAFGLVIGFAGCSKNDTVTQVAPLTDSQALQNQVATIDSIAAFSTSDEATIDDGGLRVDEYESLSAAMNALPASAGKLTADSTYPLRWGRHITGVTRDYHVVIVGDTA